MENRERNYATGREKPVFGWSRGIEALSTVAVVALLATAMALVLSGCPGTGGGDEGTSTTTVAPGDADGTESGGETEEVTTTVMLDAMSTFKSKDPFVQQALPPTSTTAGTDNTDTTSENGSTTTTTESGTTSTTQPSGVDTPLHSLRVLSIDVSSGTPSVTFKVDGTVYEDREIGDVASTSWGEIKVLDIDAEAQTVTFLHGSETRELAVGQEFLK